MNLFEHMSRPGALLLLALSPILAGAPDGIDQALKLYRYTDYDGSLQILQQIQPKTAPVLELMGKDCYMQGDYKKATEYLDKALAADPSNARYALWLGRAYGRRAETSSPFTAPLNASKARQYMEKSVQLDPRNVEAMGDLFEYYLEAPGFLGGGLDKATALASHISQVEPAEGQAALARLAERRKEYSTAEHHLRLAAEMAPHQVGRLVDLAKFFAKQGRYQESEQSLVKAEKIAPNTPSLLYVRADLYIKQRRNLATARQLLERYLQAQLSPDDPPRSEAEKLMKQAAGG